MSLAQVDLLDPALEGAAPGRAVRPLAVVLGSIGLFALAAVPIVFAVLVLMRPDLLLPR